MSRGTKWAREKVERAKRAVVEAERRLAKAQEAIAKANAGVLRAERHLKSAKRKLKLAGQRAVALEAEKAAVSVRARAMAERVIEGWTLQQIGDEWGINKDRVRQIVVGTAGRAAGWPSDFDRSTKSCARQLVEGR
jgi:chromosome segregation ATPase